jgi:hypothetical protein
MSNLQSGTALAQMASMRGFIVAACLLLMTGCSASETGPTSPLDTEFTLAPGESRRIDGEALSIRFDGVAGDSRCPADALCVLGGSATVRIAVVSGFSRHPYELRTGDLQPVRHDRLTITLVQLAPYPFSARTIAPDEYRASFTVTR